GWRDCRALITFGTPYRGSANALNYLANGYKKLGSFHETKKVVTSLHISTAGITMKASLSLSGIVPSMRSKANQEEAIRRLQHPWRTLREPTPCRALSSPRLEATAMALWAHGDGASAQAARLLPTRGRGRSPVRAGLTAQPSRPLKLLQSRVQSVPSPGACHFCSDDGYGKT